MASMGMLSVPSSSMARMALVASSPSIRGMRISMSTAEKYPAPLDLYRSAASWPSSAVSTSMPRISRRVLAISRFSSLSSASSTRQPEKSSRSFSAPFSSDRFTARAKASYMVLPNNGFDIKQFTPALLASSSMRLQS